MSISSIFIYNFSLRAREDDENQVALSYYSLKEEISNFKNLNISLLSGFGAYIQLKDTTDDEEIYQYLDFLLRDHLEDIRNIGVFIDTTIMWVYPLKGNEEAIGKDVTTIPEQREDVLRVKNNLETLFVGPVDLIQGGEAFIVRMPLLRNDTYWGMISIVLKAENAFKFVDQHAEVYKIDYLVTPADRPGKIIDDEHRAILERCNIIVESALKQLEFDETIRNVELVLFEMEKHFNDEIDILNKVGYPDVEKHKKIHAGLLAKTRAIFEQAIQRDISAVEFFSFLLIVVVEGHFQNEDVKYFPYIAEDKKD